MFRILKSNLNLYKNFHKTHKFCSTAADTYVQGISHKLGFTEYYFYISPDGMIFLDDDVRKNFTSCIKDKKFVDYFMRRLVINTTDRHADVFPYLSIFQKDRCYVRCDRLPIIFTQIITKGKCFELSICRSGSLYTRPFEPEKLLYAKKSNNIYHPANARQGSIGVLSPQLVDELKDKFQFDEPYSSYPTYFVFNDHKYTLTTDWHKVAHLLLPL